MHPRACFPNALMIDSSTIKNDKEVMIRVVVHKSGDNHVDEQCTIHIQRICEGLDWERCKDASLHVGSKLQRSGRDGPIPIRHNPLMQTECQNAGLPYGFDGHMYAVGKHVHQYASNKTYAEYTNTHTFHPQLRIMSEIMAHIFGDDYIGR